MSIGTVNSVLAAAGENDQPSVRVRRTAVTFDSAGGARMGGLPRFAPVVTDFADLTRFTEPVVVNGRTWTPSDLVATVIACLIDADEPAAAPVATYPACYTERWLSPLRRALIRHGAADVMLMPEPVAAVEWLDAEHGVSESGLTLVYDLGGSSLDVAVVRTEGDRDKRGILGRPVRSHEYGGRPLGTVLARYARALAPGVTPVSKVVPAGDTTRLRTWTVRNSLRVVRKCVHGAGLTMRDIDRILLVGGAARPPEVAQVLGELGPPVVLSRDPAHTTAIGAAVAAARMADPGAGPGRYARGAAVLSSAAVASAMAMSAATMLGSGPIGTDGPSLEFAPALAGPATGARTQFRDLQVFADLDAGPGLPGGADGLLSTVAAVRSNGSAAAAVSAVASAATQTVERAVRDRGPGTHCDPVSLRQTATYANPARFTNPLPFASSVGTASSGGTIPSVSLPGRKPGSQSDVARGVSTPGPVAPGTGLSSTPGGATGTASAGGSGSGTGLSEGPAPIAATGTGSAGGNGWSATQPSGGSSGGGSAQGVGAGAGGASTPGTPSAGGASSGDGSSSAASGSGAGGGSGSAGSGDGGGATSGGVGGGSAGGGATSGGEGATSGGGSGGSVGGGFGGGSTSGGIGGGATSGGSAGSVGGGFGGGGTSGGGGGSTSSGATSGGLGGNSSSSSTGGNSGGGSKSGGSSGGSSHGGSGGGSGGGGGSRR
ncbi:hypothetical protein BJY24_007467 [Nocardia transvalensis]|uniref:Hsp70 protein n=1 Tax=Nocardia transvalensis TaxID=37333 RepID=A0A7W9UN80_9NOCA|nr:Hsp70 family protein [Nocardia transvalensis]MBB5918555.1 hypothetical protein [Nocardia transvalensis]